MYFHFAFHFFLYIFVRCLKHKNSFVISEMNIGQIFKLFLAVAAVWPLGAVAVDPVGRASWEYMSAAALGRRTRSFPELGALPRTIATGDRGPFHVQGIAVDLKRGHIYFSFTTQLLKFDLQGRLIGSVDGLTGHLGCLTMNPDDGRVYGSLEYKDDAIGQGIRSKLTERDAAEVEASDRTGFYVAIFDVDRITRPGMDAERDRVMTTVYIGEAVADYRAQVTDGGSVREHRFGCSGIDGVTFGPRMGTRRGNLLSGARDHLRPHAGQPAPQRAAKAGAQILCAHRQHFIRRAEPGLRPCVGQLLHGGLPRQQVVLSQLFALRGRRQCRTAP